MCDSTIWSVISILKLTAGMLFRTLSDAFTEGILRHARGFDLSCHFSVLHTTGVSLLSADTAPFYLLAAMSCQCYPYIWTDQRRFFLQGLVCQFWEVCQPGYSMNALPARDKTEMTRQSPFCQHCHGSRGTAVYPKVNGMTPGTESARLRETCACFT